LKKFPAEEYNLPFFHEASYVRKLCPKCNTYYWTQNPDQETCGEASSKGCASYTFLNDPPTKRSYTLREMRESFLSFFEKHGHARIKPYPVVARWREDLYLTHASIIDFQPYVTDGLAPAPANPLVISQPCIRLVDVDNTGPTFGRHMTIFEMGGAHAFNYPDKEVYWKDQTVRYQNQWLTKDLGVKPEEIVYKEEVWSGGGNAGPCVESIIRGLEVDTLVFMQYKVVNDEFIKLPIRTVDTGYGIDRYTWISQGTPSGFHAIYGDLLEKIFKMAGLTNIDKKLLTTVAIVSGLVSVDKAASRMQTRRKEAELAGLNAEELEEFVRPIENAYAVADHTKCLSFILSEGVVPSNIQEGYLARLLFRRLYRLLRTLRIQEKLYDIMDMQISLWSNDFPQIKEMRNEIIEMVKVEEDKFEETIKRGQGMVKRISDELKEKGKKEISPETLTELYDSHGLPPEIVKQAAENENVKVEIPDDFYTLIAQRHMQVSKPVEEKNVFEERLKKLVEKIAPTKLLYYQDQYMTDFEAKVLKVLEKEYVILDVTCFFPEGGGQPPDSGFLSFEGKKSEISDVQKVGNIIIHKVKGRVPDEGKTVKGEIDWNKRYGLMKNHTATHVIGGAAKRVLGQHVWQYGTQKGIVSSRLDISHYRRLTLEELHKIEMLANEAVMKNIKIDISWLPRNEAESKYGFRLYQGGAVPGKEIRVVRAGDWDVEACAGTHLKSTGEIGFIKIIHSERVQDGVERLEYSIGVEGVKAVQKNEKLLMKLSETLNAPVEKLDQTAERVIRELKETNVEKRKLVKELATRESNTAEETEACNISEANGVRIMLRDFKESIDVDRMIQTATEIIKKDEATVTIFYGANQESARIIVMAGNTAIEKGANSGSIVKEAATVIGGSGGGRPNFAQGGGTQVQNISKAVRKAKETLIGQLKT
jgi:alanyl-tRNA synthetase